MDHFTIYIVLSTQTKTQCSWHFCCFKALVEKNFKAKIFTIYSDQGGEYQALKSVLALHDIFHFTTTPHTPKHNGYYECHHRHIVETNLSLIAHRDGKLTGKFGYSPRPPPFGMGMEILYLGMGWV